MGFYAPGTLVAEARRRGVEVRPIDLLFSGWDCTLEHDVSPPALRLGLRMVRGLAGAARDALEEALARSSLTSLDALVFESRLDDRALKALARADAFRSLWPGRRQALWALLRRLRERGLPLPLRRPDETHISPLPSMSLVEEVATDYAMTGTSAGPHPMCFQRPLLDRAGVIPSHRLATLDLPMDHRGRSTQTLSVAGLVICRQRPRSAKGMLFLTLEDEHGMMNVVVMPDLFERHRLLLATEPALMVRGVLERHQNVIHILAQHFTPLTAHAGHPGTRAFH